MLQSPSSAIYNTFISGLGKLEQHPIGDTMAKEILGINVPKIAITRTKDERIDTAVSEIGNTVAFAAGGISLDYALKRVFNREVAKATVNKQLAEHWSVIGRSFALSSLIFSLLWVMPFVRNYVTAKRIGTDKFTDVIGADKQHGKVASESSLEKSLGVYKRKIAEILSLGLGGAALFSVLGLKGVRNSGRNWGGKFVRVFFPPEPNLVQKAATKLNILAHPEKKAALTLSQRLRNLPKHLLIENGSFDKFGGWPALLFWGVPAYGGWIHASRDPYEKKEQLLKFANFTLSFFGPALILNRFFKKQSQQKFPELKNEFTNAAIRKTYTRNPEKMNRALKLWATKNGLSLVSSIIFLGTLPQLLNIYLTKRRIEKQHFHMQG